MIARIAAVAMLVSACAGGAANTTTSSTVPPRPVAVPFAEGFVHPVQVVVRPGDDRVFVVDRVGVVWALDGDAREPILDVSAGISTDRARGLLSVAFHPEDGERLVVFRTLPDGLILITEHRFPEGAAAADPDPIRTILALDHPEGFDAISEGDRLVVHDGGTVVFGPDGYLYVSIGDGAGSNDPLQQAQDPTTLHGSILRLDLDGGDPYGIPADNPFADGRGGAPEVWAYGLRNPWRISIDGDDLWIGDVGQNRREEVDRISITTGGANLGWPIMEAGRCHRGTAEQCADPSLVAPIAQYRHEEGRCAVTGGIVYRGEDIPQWSGRYLFADFCTGQVRTLRVREDGSVRVRLSNVFLPGITSLGVDGSGRLFATAGTTVYRITLGS